MVEEMLFSKRVRKNVMVSYVAMKVIQSSRIPRKGVGIKICAEF